MGFTQITSTHLCSSISSQHKLRPRFSLGHQPALVTGLLAWRHAREVAPLLPHMSRTSPHPSHSSAGTKERDGNTSSDALAVPAHACPANIQLHSAQPGTHPQHQLEVGPQGEEGTMLTPCVFAATAFYSSGIWVVRLFSKPQKTPLRKCFVSLQNQTKFHFHIALYQGVLAA